MPREIVLIKLCDVCWAREVKTEAVDTLSFARDGVALRLDVCLEHGDPSWSVLRACAVADDEAEAPRRRGRPTAAVSRSLTVNGIECPLCSKGLLNEQGLRMHLTRTHDLEGKKEQRDALVAQAVRL